MKVCLAATPGKTEPAGFHRRKAVAPLKGDAPIHLYEAVQQFPSPKGGGPIEGRGPAGYGFYTRYPFPSPKGGGPIEGKLGSICTDESKPGFHRRKAVAPLEAVLQSFQQRPDGGLSAMETRLDSSVQMLPSLPSMGPPPFGDGNGRHQAVAGRTEGPPPMGPPPFGDGNRASTASTVRFAITFNGATAFRRWKQTPGLLLSRPGRAFNGATAFRRWKLLKSGVVDAGFGPSMGPPPFGDGNKVLRYDQGSL